MGPGTMTEKHTVQDISGTVKRRKLSLGGHIAAEQITFGAWQSMPGCLIMEGRGDTRPEERWRDELQPNWGTVNPITNNKFKIESFGDIMLRPSSSSGLIQAEK